MLEGLIRERGEGQVVEQVAYTWFNRFTALRFMDVNGYTEIGVLSPESASPGRKRGQGDGRTD